MKFLYKFGNLLGSVYHKGNVQFTPDGNSLLSPVGNRVTIFDLRNNKSQTLPSACELNVTVCTLSPDGSIAILVDEEGRALLINLYSQTVLHRYNFHQPIHWIAFSPDGRKFAVTKGNNVVVYHTPGRSKELNPFTVYRSYFGAYDEIMHIDWTSDSKVFCASGRDMNSRVYGLDKFKTLVVCSLGGHSDSIVASFFEENSLDVYSLSRNGQLCVWDCDSKLSSLEPLHTPTDLVSGEKGAAVKDIEEDDRSPDEPKDQLNSTTDDPTTTKIHYKRIAKFSFAQGRGENMALSKVTCASFHKSTHILVTGFEDGVFCLHELPEFNLIHSLSLTNHGISTVAFNKSGDWLAVGSRDIGQLIVWEWASESYIFKQQGHFNCLRRLAYSPDGQFIATGGDDSKVKVWNVTDGLCFVTFSGHTAAVTGVCFVQSGKAILSSSLDGSVRAFDMKR